MADQGETQGQILGIHMTNFIICCLSGGWSGIWGFCVIPFLLGRTMHTGTTGSPTTCPWSNLASLAPQTPDSVGWATWKWEREGCLFSVSVEAAGAIVPTDLNQHALGSNGGN